jgi:micrococcal nuclease
MAAFLPCKASMKLLPGMHVVLRLIVLAAFLTPGLSDAHAQTSLTGQVLRVIDGDTIRVRIGNREERVRYIGMNTPELHHPEKGLEPFGREAAESNRALVGDQTVRLELDVQERDKYGRLLAYVYLGDTMVNAELVANGYAQVMTIPPNVRHQDLFLKLQREARLLQLGLWNPAAAPPAPAASRTIQQVAPRQTVDGRPGAPSLDAWTCPTTHPIKGNFRPYSGERCIYHPPSGAFYGKTTPERCYATDEEARADGCRVSRQ